MQLLYLFHPELNVFSEFQQGRGLKFRVNHYYILMSLEFCSHPAYFSWGHKRNFVVFIASLLVTCWFQCKGVMWKNIGRFTYLEKSSFFVVDLGL